MGRASSRWPTSGKELAEGVAAVLLAAFVPFLVTCLITMLPGSAIKEIAADGTASIRYPSWCLIAMLVVGGGLVAAGLRLGLTRQLYNWLLVGAGVAVLVPGAAYLALERTTVTDAGFSVRSWWGLCRDELRFADLTGVKMAMEQRPPWSRRPLRQWLVYHTKAGEEGELLSNRFTGLYYANAGSEIVIRWGKFIRGGVWPKPDFPQRVR